MNKNLGTFLAIGLVGMMESVDKSAMNKPMHYKSSIGDTSRAKLLTKVQVKKRKHKNKMSKKS